MRAAQRAPARIAGLVLAQTPSLAAMQAWTGRVIPAPIRVPVLGQTIAWLFRVFRERIAHGWYRAALPRAADPGPWRRTAKQALSCGGCFCLPGAEIVRFPDCGHFPDVEAPERFAAIVLAQVARQW